ncbi:MAG: zf-HC2 domain-containing protein [Nitrospirae bacterium]|nr:MAG: zf-HC2 domain-containing protein [Nitrospirota bacterium]
MTMTCSEIKELTVPYLELDLEPSRVRDVTAHLEGCAGCRTEMETVRQVLVRVKGVAVPDPGDRFWDEFSDRVRRELAREWEQGRSQAAPLRRPKRAMTMWPMALAASVLLLVGAWSLKGMLDREPAPSPPRTVAQGSPPPALEPDLPRLAEADWQAFWDEDHDMVLAEMASRLDRKTVDRLFGDI